ncbi:aldo/keto reductase [Mitsuokella sp.]|uniref:aldo/keto reductase n=1 Tax=Mitsuokella sp. TaxID=2049034 RepID=UPI003D7C885B
MTQTYVALNDGNKIPQFGLGVFMVPAGGQTETAVYNALKLGIRHIDTAHAYQNERSVGKAINKAMREGIVKGDDVWVTSKLWPSEYGEGKTAAAIDKMLERLNIGYIDLLLLHQQFGDYKGAWKDMERAVKAGKVRSIGISNFESANLEDLMNAAAIKPSVLQVECHPYWQQTELKKRIAPYGTVIESWYPLGHGAKDLINEEIFTRLGQKYRKSNVQIILRWHIQEGNIVFPKTVNPQHMKENFNIFDFELTDDEMNEIRKLDGTKRYYNVSLEDQIKTLGAWKPAD